MTPFDLLAVLLVAAGAIGCINRLSLQLPAAIGFVAGSLALAALALAADPFTGGRVSAWMQGALAQLDLSGVFLGGVLGLLLFAATFEVSIAELREHKSIIFLLATATVILSTALFAFGLYAICRLAGYDLPLRWCAVIGAILAPTDAVVVDELLRRVHLPPALRAAIAGESLLNDGAGIVLFVVTLQLVAGNTGVIGHGRVAAAILREGLGGAALGVAAGLLARAAIARLEDDGLRLIVSLALVLVSYRAADALGISGPIAVVAAGLAFGRGMHSEAGQGRRTPVMDFWLLLHAVLNALLFLLIGLQAVEVAYAELAWLPVVVSIPLAVLSRLLSIAIPVACLGGDWSAQYRRVTVLTWAGMRGGVSIAMVLATPDSPWRGELLAICLAVVLFTVCAQGLTLPWALNRLFGGRIGAAARAPEP
ncbi:MAG: sodium:proton antiporter [Acetobacteraceae bacterium]|nr:sodium:proton antiporter [Acetobacteraceae bacterium]